MIYIAFSLTPCDLAICILFTLTQCALVIYILHSLSHSALSQYVYYSLSVTALRLSCSGSRSHAAPNDSDCVQCYSSPAFVAPPAALSSSTEYAEIDAPTDLVRKITNVQDLHSQLTTRILATCGHQLNIEALVCSRWYSCICKIPRKMVPMRTTQLLQVMSNPLQRLPLFDPLCLYLCLLTLCHAVSLTIFLFLALLQCSVSLILFHFLSLSHSASLGHFLDLCFH